MKAKGTSSGSQIGNNESETSLADVREFSELHDPEARRKILEHATQTLKDARALIERLNKMDDERSSNKAHVPKPSKS